MAFGLEKKINDKIVSINGERYVYYDRLQEDGFVDLYEKAYDRTLIPRVDSGADPKSIAQYFLRLRRVEYTKECALLKEKFGTEITDQYSNRVGDVSKVGGQLIHSFNKILGLRDTFNYHLDLIKHTKQKGVVAYITQYFGKQWNASIDELVKILDDAINNGLDLQDVVQDYVKEVLRRTLFQIYGEAGNQKGAADTDPESKPYIELAKFYEDKVKSEPLLDAMLEGLGLNKFVSNIISDINNSGLNNLDLNTLKTNTALNFKKGGFAKEIEAVVIANLAEDLNKLPNCKVTYSGLGKQKADWYITIGFDPTVIAEQVSPSFVGKSRSEYVQDAKAISDKLKQLDGFLIYVSSKDYTVDGNFFNQIGGYPADQRISLQAWEDMLTTVGLRSKDIVFMIMQTIPGAIGQNKITDISTLMARAIAGAMFDDFDVRGVVPEDGAKAIHLLYLNGIYIPLSFFYDKVFQAFAQFGDAQDIIKVDINTPTSIEFPEAEDQRRWEEENPDQSAWRYQGDIALQQINLSYHFFHNFREAMQDIGYME